MSSGDLTILVFGATGYLGGSLAAELTKKYPSAHYIGHARSSKSSDVVRKYGSAWTPLVDSGNAEEDYAAISRAAASADIVVNAANCDDLPLVQAILAGLEVTEKKLPVYLHVSGAGLVSKSFTGKFEEAESKIWDDNKVEDIRSIPPEALHRNVDLAVFNAAGKGKFISYIVAPSTIYGTAHSSHGNKLSVQLPRLIRASIQKRKAIYGGEGTNICGNVHIDDAVDLLTLVLEKALEERASGSGSFPADRDPYERFYWATTSDHVWGSVSRALGPILFEKGLADTPEAESVPAAEAFETFTTMNSLTAANRAFKDGWKPKRGPLVDYLKEAVEDVLAPQ